MLYSTKLQENLDDTQVANTQTTNTQTTTTTTTTNANIPKTQEQILLETHNKYFKYHNPDAPDLKWNSDLAIGAKKWAEYLLKTNTFKHSKKTGAKLTDMMRSSGIGENMGRQRKDATRDIAYLRKDYNKKDGKTEIVSYNNVDAWYNDYLIDDLKQTYILNKANRPTFDQFGKKIKNDPKLPSIGECAWYKINSDKSKLDLSEPSFEQWGHFTQLVWRNNKQVEIGCGTASPKQSKPGDLEYTICRYNPGGNYYDRTNLSKTEQKYRQNVIFPKTGCYMRPVLTDTNNITTNTTSTTTNNTTRL